MTIDPRNTAETLQFQDDEVLDMIEKLAAEEGVDPLFWIERAAVWWLNIKDFLQMDGTMLHVVDENDDSYACVAASSTDEGE